MRHIAWLAALVAIAGCTTMGQPYSEPPPLPEGKARVFFVRSSVSYGNAWITVFSIDNTEAISLYDKGYSWVYLDPGTHKFSAGTIMTQEQLKFEMPVRAGREYYVEYTQEPAGYNRYRNVIRAVSPTLGKELVQKYFYKPPEKQDFQPAAKQ